MATRAPPPRAQGPSAEPAAPQTGAAMDEDAAQRSDSGEKFNGGGQRRKRPRKVSCLQMGRRLRTGRECERDGGPAPPSAGGSQGRARPRRGPRGGRRGQGVLAAAPAGCLGVSWHRDGRFIFRMSQSEREGGGGGSRSTGRIGGWRCAP